MPRLKTRSKLSLAALIAAAGLSSMAVAGLVIDDDQNQERHEHHDGGEHASHDHDGQGEHAAREHDGKREAAARGSNARVGDYLGRLADALESGKMTTAQAIEQLRGMQRRLAAGQRGTDRVTDRASDRAPGRASDRVKDRASDRAPRRMSDDHRAMLQDYRHAQEELHQAVEAGQISEADAKRRLGTMRTRIEEATANTDARGHEGAEGNDGSDGKKTGEAREGRERRATWEGFERRINAGLESGRLTEAQAKEARQQFRRRMAGEGDHDRADGDRRRDRAQSDKPRGRDRGDQKNTDRVRGDVDWAAIKARLHGAVESGQMTQAEADAVLKGMAERLRRHKEGGGKG